MGLMTELKAKVREAHAAKSGSATNARILASVGLDTALTPKKKKRTTDMLATPATQTTEDTKNVLG